jgi:hypothetical protein
MSRTTTLADPPLDRAIPAPGWPAPRPGADPTRVELTSAAVAEFAGAMEDYKRRHGRPFPTWSEVFEVLRGLGYAKPGDRHRVLITRDGPMVEEIAQSLARYGGVPLDSGAARVYGFRSESARDAALAAIRSAYGWTSIEPRY